MVTLRKHSKEEFINAWLKYYEIEVKNYFICNGYAFMYFIKNDRIVVMNIVQDGNDETMDNEYKQLDNSIYVEALKQVYKHDPSLEMSNMLIEFAEYMFGSEGPDGMYITKAIFRED